MVARDWLLGDRSVCVPLAPVSQVLNCSHPPVCVVCVFVCGVCRVCVCRVCVCVCLCVRVCTFCKIKL